MIKPLFFILLFSLPAIAQVRVHSSPVAFSIAEPAQVMPPDPREIEDPEQQGDPAYSMYKEGYNLILEERWNDARETFNQLITKYPKSEYIDEAKYWTSYALSYTDKKKAIENYKKFIKEYPSSTYYDDAIADLNKLDGNIVVSTSSGGSVAISTAHGKGYSYTTAPSVRQANRALRATLQKLPRLTTTPRPARYPHPMVFMPSMSSGGDRDDLDPETRIKMDALTALGDMKEDSLSFKTLRDVALDRKQLRQLRETAMDALSDFHKFDALPVFVEIAKQDTSEEMQTMAIDYIGQLSNNKNRSVETLSDLFYAIPPYRYEQRMTVLNAVAEIGNDKAVDLLAKIARTNDNYDVRSEAVYYLGNIGSDKARAALYDILRGK